MLTLLHVGFGEGQDATFVPFVVSPEKLWYWWWWWWWWQ